MNKPTNTYQAYYKTNVQTSDQLTLIVMLYEGLLRFLKKALVKIEENDVEGAHNYLVRSQNIVSELLATLRVDKGGDVAKNLKDLYSYAFRRIVEANLKKDPHMVEEVIRVMEPLKQGWIQIKEQQNQEKQKVATTDVQKRVNFHG